MQFPAPLASSAVKVTAVLALAAAVVYLAHVQQATPERVVIEHDVVAEQTVEAPSAVEVPSTIPTPPRVPIPVRRDSVPGDLAPAPADEGADLLVRSAVDLVDKIHAHLVYVNPFARAPYVTFGDVGFPTHDGQVRLQGGTFTLDGSTMMIQLTGHGVDGRMLYASISGLRPGDVMVTVEGTDGAHRFSPDGARARRGLEAELAHRFETYRAQRLSIAQRALRRVAEEVAAGTLRPGAMVADGVIYDSDVLGGVEVSHAADGRVTATTKELVTGVPLKVTVPGPAPVAETAIPAEAVPVEASQEPTLPEDDCWTLDDGTRACRSITVPLSSVAATPSQGSGSDDVRP